MGSTKFALTLYVRCWEEQACRYNHSDFRCKLNCERFEAFSGLPDTPENRAQFVSNVPLGRLCEASDVANACVFLASDESKFITGINLEVDGGRAV